MAAIEPLQLVLRLVAATLCGGLIGLERELHGKPVGLKTVTLVAVGTAVLTLVGVEVTLMPGTNGYSTGGDLGRMLQGMTAGLGMLGAGMFLAPRQRHPDGDVGSRRLAGQRRGHRLRPRTIPARRHRDGHRPCHPCRHRLCWVPYGGGKARRSFQGRGITKAPPGG